MTWCGRERLLETQFRCRELSHELGEHKPTLARKHSAYIVRAGLPPVRLALTFAMCTHDVARFCASGHTGRDHLVRNLTFSSANAAVLGFDVAAFHEKEKSSSGIDGQLRFWYAICKEQA